MNGEAFIRPSARAVIIKDGRLAMIHSLKYNYYKFPGGGIEAGEDKKQALIRETAEETGLVVIPESIKEYGYVHRIQKGDFQDVFIQDNYYYLCSVKEDRHTERSLDDYEQEESFTLEYVTPELILEVNKNADHGDADIIMIGRESRVTEELMKDGCI